MGRYLPSSASSLFSRMELGLSSITRRLSSSVSWWRSTEFNFSLPRFAPNWTLLLSDLYWPLDLGFSVAADTVLWAVITALESIALVSMLGFFFLFCGCTL